MPDKPSVAIVSESGGWPLRFSLSDVDLLSRLVEAYVLHDSVICFADSANPIVPDLDAMVVEIRYDWYAETFSPLLDPLLTATAKEEHIEVERLLRVMRSPVGSRRFAFPSRPRSPKNWLSLVDTAKDGITRAELMLSEQMQSTYYPSERGADLVGTWVGEYSGSASTLLKRFTDARSAQILAASRLIGPRQVDLSPPLLFAYAVASADTLPGFVRAVEDLRNDSATRRLRKFVTKLAEAETADQIELAQVIKDEFTKLLGGDLRGALKAAEVAHSVPALLTGSWWGGLVDGSLSAMRAADIIQRLVVRRHLTIFRKLHRRTPSVRGFFSDLVRLFPDVRFSEQQLAAWAIDPKLVHLDQPVATARGPLDEKRFNASTRRKLQQLNREIRRARREK